TLAGNVVTFQATVTGDPSAGVDSVWVTWAGLGAGGAGQGGSIPMGPVAGNPKLYSGQVTLASGANPPGIPFIVPAANGVGLVTVSDNLGAYNRIYDASAVSAQAPTAVALGASPSAGSFGGAAHVSATLTRNGTPVAGKTVTFSIGADQATGATDA